MSETKIGFQRKTEPEHGITFHMIDKSLNARLKLTMTDTQSLVGLSRMLSEIIADKNK